MNAGTAAAIRKSEVLREQILMAWEHTPNLTSVASEIRCSKKTVRLAVQEAGRGGELEGQKRTGRREEILRLWNNGDGLSARQIAKNLQCNTSTVERTIHNAGLGNTLTGQVKVKRKRRKIKPKKSLGKPESWESTLRIIKGLIDGKSHNDLKELFSTTKETISKVCARAKLAGFELESQVVLGRKESIRFYRAAFMLFQKKAVRTIAKVLNTKEDNVRELRQLVKEILLPEVQKG